MHKLLFLQIISLCPNMWHASSESLQLDNTRSFQWDAVCDITLTTVSHVQRFVVTIGYSHT